MKTQPLKEIIFSWIGYLAGWWETGQAFWETAGSTSKKCSSMKSNLEVHQLFWLALTIWSLTCVLQVRTYPWLGLGSFRHNFPWKELGKGPGPVWPMLLQSKILNFRSSWKEGWKRSRTTLIQCGFSYSLKGRDTQRRNIWQEKSFPSHVAYLSWSTAWSQEAKAGASPWQILRLNPFHGFMMSPSFVRRIHHLPLHLCCWAKPPRLTCTSGDLSWRIFLKMKRAQQHGYRASLWQRTLSWRSSKAQAVLRE